jgi:hypothetical protein
LSRWVLDLAVESYLIHSQIVEKVQNFAQSNGGQRWQEVRLISVWNEGKTSINQPDGKCELYWPDLVYTGKKSEDVAKGMKHSLEKIGLVDKKLQGSTSDSGTGTPEIDLLHFLTWLLLAAISAKQLLAIEGHPVFAHFRQDIEHISHGINIWD